MNGPQAIRANTFDQFAYYHSDTHGVGEPEPQANWLPNGDGLLYAQAGCGKHYHHYDPADVIAGNLPCPQGCASPAFKAA